jgi:MoaA/NifB/PqqE/SkfB family radical SAM enzyme
MLNLGKFILKRMLLDTEKLMFALPRMFPPSEPKLTALRIKNFISSYLNWKFGLGLKSKPVILQVEPVKGCNLNCVMCGAGQLRIQKLPFDNFKKIIDNFPEAIFITLNYGGEPFLSKDTLKMINYAQRKAIVIIFSNFTVLPSPEDIINSGLFEINASIDSFDKQKYEFVRKGGELNKIIDKIRVDIEKLEITKREKMRAKLESLYQEAIKNQVIKNKREYQNGNDNTLDIVVKNLKNLVDTRKKLKKKLPIISISAVFAKETKEDAEDIIKNAIDLGVDRVKFQKLAFDVPGVFHIPDPDDFFFLQKLKQKYKNQIEMSIVNFELGGDYPRGYCYLAHFMATIDVDKKIIPCCMPYPYMDMNDPSFGVASSEENIKVAVEKRQEFIKNFRSSPPNFCLECPLYFRK